MLLLKQLWVQIRAALVALVFFYCDVVGVGVGVMTDAGHLPAHFGMRTPAGNQEVVVLNLTSNIKVRSRRANSRELVAEVLVQRLEVIRQCHPGLAFAVDGHHTIVDVFHLGRFNRGMIEVLVGGIKRIVNFEVFGSSRNGAADAESSSYMHVAAGAAGCQDDAAALVATEPGAAIDPHVPATTPPATVPPSPPPPCHH